MRLLVLGLETMVLVLVLVLTEGREQSGEGERGAQKVRRLRLGEERSRGGIETSNNALRRTFLTDAGDLRSIIFTSQRVSNVLASFRGTRSLHQRQSWSKRFHEQYRRLTAAVCNKLGKSELKEKHAQTDSNPRQN